MYFVRVGTAVRASLDERGLVLGKAVRVEAKREGVDGNNIRVEIKDVQILALAGVNRTGITRGRLT